MSLTVIKRMTCVCCWNPGACRGRAVDDAGMDMPAAEVHVDDELVSELVRSQHPDLAGSVRRIANGWDNAVYRLGDDLTVRLPRREVAVALVLNEQRWLPELAGRLPVPIPAPVRVGVPDSGYPWPWTIGRWTEGRPAIDLPPDRRTPIAAALAEFFAALHRPAPADAPYNPVRGVPLDTRDEAVRGRIADGLVPRPAEVAAAWDELLATPGWDGPPLWQHGDPQPANLVMAGDRLAAVIDFGDLNAGDPATDLAAAWLLFDPAGRQAFRTRTDGLRGWDDATWTRARGWALAIATAMTAHSDDNPPLARTGTYVIDQVLGDG